MNDSRPADDETARAARDSARRRALDAVFGTVLPDTTSDERDPGGPAPGRDDWYHENRPPHHDR